MLTIQETELELQLKRRKTTGCNMSEDAMRKKQKFSWTGQCWMADSSRNDAM
jgi:hypothetical protein